MKQTVIALPGDGIGPEVVEAALEVLNIVCSRAAVELEVRRFPIGGEAIGEYGEPLPSFVLEACLDSGVLLLGAVGHPRYDRHPPDQRPEKALLSLRREMGLFANLRPVTVFDALVESSPLRPESVRGADLLVVRELTGGIYFGEPRGIENRNGSRVAFNTEVYSEDEIERIARVAFESARTRRRLVTSVDKSNVLETSQLWREVVEGVAAEFSDVQLEHLLVDNCAMQLVTSPGHFDVLLTSNLFGDILSDEAAVIGGSIGLLPSASLGAPRDGVRSGLYEPVHGSAPNIAGQGKANPMAAILSAALLLRHSLGRDDLALKIESAVKQVLDEGWRTADLGETGRIVNTREMTDLVLRKVG